jgi:NADH-quinone oxidoreductase subunit N
VPISIPSVAWGPLLPVVLLPLAGFLVLLLDLATPPGRKGMLAYLALAGIALAAAAAAGQGGAPALAFGATLALDGFTTFFVLLIAAVAALSVLLAHPYLQAEGAEPGAYYALILFAAFGMILMAASLELMTTFLGLETLSIALYVLAGYFRERVRSNEAALKYLLLGAFASAFFLYGVAFVYGASGTTNLRRAVAALAGQPTSPLLLVAMGLLIVGLGFKLALVPFHMWVPDVYQGAPTSVTAFMIAGTKAAAFAALLRILTTVLAPLQADWSRVLWVLAACTMTLGNVVAISQRNIKRLLAYSSIAHAGYVLVAIVGGTSGYASVLFYLLAYALMNLGAFAVVVALERSGEEGLELGDYRGLGWRRPGLALCMAIFMFALTGIPPTSGFMGKLYLFSAAIEGRYVWLAIIGVLNSVASAYYYLGVVVAMYMGEPAPAAPAGRLAAALAAALVLATAATLWLGLFPAWALEMAQRSLAALTG